MDKNLIRDHESKFQMILFSETLLWMHSKFSAGNIVFLGINSPMGRYSL